MFSCSPRQVTHAANRADDVCGNDQDGGPVSGTHCAAGMRGAAQGPPVWTAHCLGARPETRERHDGQVPSLLG